MRVFANHCHLMPDRPRRRPGDVAALLAHLDALGIDEAVAFAPYASDFDGDLLRANEWLLERLAATDRLTPFATIDPTHPDAVAVLERMHAAGVRGCKLHPGVQDFDVADPRARPFYEASAERGIVLAIHTGGLHRRPLAMDDPVKLDTILFEVPGLRIILEHVAGRVWWRTALAIAANHGGRRPRAFLGITSVLERPDHVLAYLGPERVVELVTGVGARQLVFGLDFPNWTLSENRRALDALLHLPVAEEERELLLGGTLRRLLAPEPAATR